MKRLLLAVILLVCPAVIAADTNKIADEAEAGRRELAAQRAVISSLSAERAELLAASERTHQASAQKIATIAIQKQQLADKDGVIAKKDEAIATANSGTLKAVCIGICGLGVLFIAIGGVGLVFGVGPTAFRAVCFGAPLLAGGIALIRYGLEFAWIGLAVAAVASLGGMAWIVYDVRRHKDAGIENGTLIPLARASGRFDDEQLAWLEQNAYLAGDPLADKLRAAAEGIDVKQLVDRAKQAVGINTKVSPR